MRISRWLRKQGLRKPQTNMLRRLWSHRQRRSTSTRESVAWFVPLGSVLLAGVVTIATPVIIPVVGKTLIPGAGIMLAGAVLLVVLLQAESRREQQGLIGLSRASDLPLEVLFSMKESHLHNMASTRLRFLGSQCANLQQEGKRAEGIETKARFEEAFQVYVDWGFVEDDGWGSYFPQTEEVV